MDMWVRISPSVPGQLGASAASLVANVCDAALGPSRRREGAQAPGVPISSRTWSRGHRAFKARARDPSPDPSAPLGKSTRCTFPVSIGMNTVGESRTTCPRPPTSTGGRPEPLPAKLRRAFRHRCARGVRCPTCGPRPTIHRPG